MLEKIAEYRPILDELKITKHELATKSDIGCLESKIVAEIIRVENKIDNIRNELIIKLGGIVVGSIFVLGVIMVFLMSHVH